MEKASFIVPAEHVGLNPVSIMGDQKAVMFTFASSLEAVSAVLPAPLEAAFPLVSGYVVEIDKPTFSAPYREAMLGVYAKYSDTVGMFPVAFLLSGPGAEMATLPGRERFGLPKKMCESLDCIKIERDGAVMHASAARGGVTLLDVELRLGEYNAPDAEGIYGNPRPGDVSGGMSFYAQPVIEPDGGGFDRFSKVNLYTNVAEYTYRAWKPGAVSVRLESSANDPWGHFPVIAPIGGAYTENDLEMKDLRLAATLDASEAMPKLLSTRYDRMGLK